MIKLLVKQATVDYHGFFTEPAFNLIGELRQIITGLAKTFASHKIGLGNFRMEGEAAEPSSAAAVVRLGRFGLYKFKFDQVQASLNGFDDDDLEGLISVIAKGNSWVRKNVNDFAFRTHAFIYTSHSALSGGTSSSFLLGLPRRSFAVPGEDLGSGILETWHDAEMDAKIRISLDHSLQETGGLYIHYMVVFERDEIDYFETAHRSRNVLEGFLNEIGLEFGEE
jgi:hypothetical protein